ncbi:unnamed protein product [Rhizophagus irregularis]|uniref:Uncharacterized protein n=1 Tax=Rhizophagus irregularis TaxID=588596 RepID=A0A915ZF67_9GLOM|nr:unnamed protein product [Rhizophagus irregularis]CAB5374030.1 unnamed protein product [Rhizophagus irregularis]CAB5386932.1 unnamed protein product [Rhizophagus irregularis]
MYKYGNDFASPQKDKIIILNVYFTNLHNLHNKYRIINRVTCHKLNIGELMPCDSKNDSSTINPIANSFNSFPIKKGIKKIQRDI